MPRHLRKFLVRHRGYYCEECLAEQLGRTVDEIRHALGAREAMDIAIFYGFCQSCLSERAVYSVRACA